MYPIVSPKNTLKWLVHSIIPIHTLWFEKNIAMEAMAHL